MAGRFIIRTLDYVGLGDQLGTQFSKLYVIGEALGLEYIPTKFTFERSCKSPFEVKVDAFFFNIQLWIISVCGKNGMSQILLKAFLILQKIVLKLKDKKALNLRLLNFLGLETKEQHFGETLKVDFYHLVSESNSFGELIHNIKSSFLLDSGTVVELAWQPSYYEISPKLDELIQAGETADWNNYLKEKFLSVRKPEASTNTMVVHMRCGDSVTIKTQHGFVTLLGEKVTYSKTGTEIEILGDPNRKNISVEKYEDFLLQVSHVKNRKELEIVFISDGYALSKKLLMHYLISNFKTLAEMEFLDIINVLKLDLDEILLRKPLGKFSDEFILGESIDELEKSILSLCKAKYLVFGTGGFSYFMHSLYGIHKHSKVQHINETYENIILELGDEF